MRMSGVSKNFRPVFKPKKKFELQHIHLCEKNLIGAELRISAHSQGPKI